MSSPPTQIGAYSIVRQLGAGGMGTVYLGRDPELDRPVAIKMLRDQVRDEELLQRFFREARAAAALRHPNIITIYASGQHDLQPYIAMELVEGASLADVIRQRRPLTLADKLSYLAQICAGLHFAHRAGIIHRDIKPANLMVDREGVIRILDFGIAHVEGSGMTRDGSMIGTLNYMSPEQMLGRPVDHRSDLFAVGAVAYELLSYRQAFPGGLNDGLLHRLPHEDPPPLRDLVPGIHPGIEQIVMRALQKAPDKRFPDLAEMRDRLLGVLQHLDEAASLQTISVRPGQARPAPPSRPSSAPATPASVRQRLADAQMQIEQGNSAAAIRLLQQVVATDPANEAASEMLGRVQTSSGSQPAPGMPLRTKALVLAGVAAVAIAAVLAVPRFMAGGATPDAIAPPPTALPQQPPIASTATPQAPQPPAALPSPALAPAPARAPTPALAPAGAPAPALARAPALSSEPSGADAALQDLLARTRTMYTSGDLAGALDLLARNPAASSDPRIGDIAGRISAAAFDAMSSAEKSAAARNAGELAGDTLRLGNDAKGRAESSRQRASVVDAGLQALMARDAFQQAAIDALAKRNQPSPAATAAPAAAAPAVAAPAAAAAPSPLDRERGALTAALGRFQAAYRDRDINALQQIFPSLQREARQKIERAFRDCRAYDVAFDDMQFLMDPGNPTVAQVNVRSTYVCTPRTGQRPVPAAQRDVFSLRKRGDAWFIDSTGNVN